MSPEQLLGSVDFPEEDVVVADFEAGVGTLTRLGEEHVDTVVIVVEATPKSLEVGQRAAGRARGTEWAWGAGSAGAEGGGSAGGAAPETSARRASGRDPRTLAPGTRDASPRLACGTTTSG